MTELTGTTTLVRLALRRDRVVLPIWILLLVLMVLGTAARYARLLPTDQDRQSFATEVRGNQVLDAFAGQIYAPSLGGLTIWKVGDAVYTLIGLMALMAVIRHTRAEEESGRQELLSAGVVGRYAPLTASLIVAWAASMLTGALTALAMIGLGLDPVGSIAFALAIAAPGWIYAAVAALAAQLTQSTRTATGIAAAVLGVGYLLRFVADGSGQTWLKWLSPQGWSHLVRPFADERWWVLALALSATLLVAGAAYLLSARRDVGAGLLPARLGPASAAGLGSPQALAWRLQRGLLLGWMVGFAVAGVFFGGLASAIPELAGQAGPNVQEFFRRYTAGPSANLVDAYLWLIALTFGYIAALYPVLATLRLRFEEAAGHAELVLSTTVGRMRWAASHLVFVALGTVAILAGGGLVIGLIYGLSSGNLAVQLPRVLAGALIQVPAVWVLGAITMFTFGVLPRFAVAISWAAFLFVNLFGEILGPTFGLDWWIADLVVPFHHLPKILSGGAFSATPLLMLIGLSILLTATGLLAFRRRDMEVS